MEGKSIVYINIYHNVLKCLKDYRKWDIISGDVTDREFITKINSHNYFSITAECNGEKCHIIIPSDNKNIKKAANFKMILSSEIPKKEDNIILMIITETDLGSNIKTSIDNFINVELRNKTVYLEMHLFSTFILETPKHIAVCPHEIASEEEVNYTINLFKISRKNFPSIYTTDPPVAWLGARPGQVIKIIAPSETSGQAIRYRLVKAKLF